MEQLNLCLSLTVPLKEILKAGFLGHVSTCKAFPHAVLNKHFLSNYFVPGIVLGSRNPLVKKTATVPVPRRVSTPWDTTGELPFSSS